MLLARVSFRQSVWSHSRKKQPANSTAAICSRRHPSSESSRGVLTTSLGLSAYASNLVLRLGSLGKRRLCLFLTAYLTKHQAQKALTLRILFSLSLAAWQAWQQSSQMRCLQAAHFLLTMSAFAYLVMA